MDQRYIMERYIRDVPTGTSAHEKFASQMGQRYIMERYLENIPGAIHQRCTACRSHPP